MTTPEADFDFKVVPLNMLPAELDPHSTPKKIEDEQQRIHDEILSKSNGDIVAADIDGKTLRLLRALGSDLNINAFALNFRVKPGSKGAWNTDVGEAKYLMTRVVERLSVDSPEDDPSKLPFVLTSTTFSKGLYD